MFIWPSVCITAIYGLYTVTIPICFFFQGYLKDSIWRSNMERNTMRTKQFDYFSNLDYNVQIRGHTQTNAINIYWIILLFYIYFPLYFYFLNCTLSKKPFFDISFTMLGRENLKWNFILLYIKFYASTSHHPNIEMFSLFIFENKISLKFILYAFHEILNYFPIKKM